MKRKDKYANVDMSFTESKKEEQHRTLWDFWVLQLRAANADGMSYGKGIIGQNYSIHDKTQHLIAYLKKMEGIED